MGKRELLVSMRAVGKAHGGSLGQLIITWADWIENNLEDSNNG